VSLPVVELWDGGPSHGLVQYSEPERFADETGDDQRLNRVYSNVGRPTLSVHRPAPERANGAAVVVFPGGAYRDVWIDKEGYDVARWLNLFGVTAIVVKYRTAPANAQESMREGVRQAALADARRAMRLAVLETVLEEELQAHALRMGRHNPDGMQPLIERYPVVGDVRGSGLFLGVELVRDRETLEPAGEEASFVANRMRDYGILFGTDGPYHNVVKIWPPMPCPEGDADRLVATMDRVLKESLWR
jgi:hypothetical protein